MMFVDKPSFHIRVLAFAAADTDRQVQLPADKFIRIHKSYIVALEQVKMIKADSVMIAGNESLPLSIHYKDGLLEKFRSK